MISAADTKTARKAEAQSVENGSPTRPQVCDVCRRSFARAEHLRRHRRIHTKEKPFVCPCGRSFARKDLLRRHERLSHDIRDGAWPVDNSPLSLGGTLEMNIAAPPHLQLGSSSNREREQATTDLQSFAGHSYSVPNGILPEYDDPVMDFSRFLDFVGSDIDWTTILPYGGVGQQEGQPTSTTNSVPDDQAEISRHHNHLRVPNGATDNDEIFGSKQINVNWLVTEPQRNAIIQSLEPFETRLSGFRLPSRIALGRYVAGFVDGYSDHHPMVHIPTLTIASYRKTPEFILALLAIGAQYRYETKVASRLYQAARSIILEHLSSGGLSSNLSILDSRPSPENRDYTEEAPSLVTMDRLRALILLATFASWQRNLGSIRESLECQGWIVSLLRIIPMTKYNHDNDGTNWHQWISTEADIRTIFNAFCFLNLQTLSYGTPPVFLNHELDLPLPSSCREWVAQTQSEWLTARAEVPPSMTFREILRSHLSAEQPQGVPPCLSPMASYVLIHALLQRIHSANSLARDWHMTALRPEEVNGLERALDQWRIIWKASPETAHSLYGTYGSLAFSSTALLGVAHSRLHCDLGPWRNLESGDPKVISAKLKEGPVPQRGPHLAHALLHAIHALSISIHMGVAYLSRRQSYSWSIHHVLCGLEFAITTSKWLHLMATADYSAAPLSDFECRVIQWIIRVVREGLESHDETSGQEDNIENLNSSGCPQKNINFLAFSVPKLWARMFITCNSPWPMARVIGESLEAYANLVDSESA